MRILKFTINDKTLAQDPECDFSGLFPSTKQKLKMQCSFSDEWDGIPKVAAFYSMLGNEHPPQILDEDNCCMIPPEAANLPAFKIQILGVNRNKMIATNTLTIYQKGGKR